MVFCPTKLKFTQGKSANEMNYPRNLLKQLAYIQIQPYELDKKSIAQIFPFQAHIDLSYFY